MLELTPQQRRELRAKAHHLDPVVSVGHNGLTPKVLHEIDVALRAHQLVKVRVFDDDRSSREAMLKRIADELSAAPVQHLGKLLILWRPAEEEAKHEPARKATRKRAAKPSPHARAPRGPLAPVRRRERGSEGSRTAPPAQAIRRRRRAADGDGERHHESRGPTRAARNDDSFDPARKRRGDGTGGTAVSRRRRVAGTPPAQPQTTASRRRTAVAERGTSAAAPRRRRRSG